MNRKLINVRSLTGYEKLKFLATVKDNDRYIVELKKQVYAETIVKNTLVFAI